MADFCTAVLRGKEIKNAPLYLMIRASLKSDIDDFAHEHRLSKAKLVEAAFRFYRGAHERGLVDVADLK